MRSFPFANGKVTVQMEIQTASGDIETVIAVPSLLHKLMEVRPGIADWVSITYTGREEVPDGRSLKVFEVAIRSTALKPGDRLPSQVETDRDWDVQGD
jgi:hypothetical protein